MFLLSLFFIAASINTFSQELPPNIDKKCDSGKSIALAFLNGVRNTTADARESKKQIKDLVQSDGNNTRISPNGLDDICYKYIYNQTDGIYDFVEVLAQKIRESDPSLSEKEVYKKVSQYWFSDQSWLANMPGDFPDKLKEAEIQRIQSTEYNTLHSDVAGIVAQDLKDRSTLVVSHSQGNLFANLLYEQLELNSTLVPRLKKYANLQVGSAASHNAAEITSYGDYYTSKQDDVIGSLSSVGSVLTPNVEMESQWLGNTQYFPFSNYDFLGHGFVEVYTDKELKGKLDGEENFRSMSSIFMDKLEGLANKIVEPKCSDGNLLPSEYNVCVKILEAPKDTSKNVVFQISSCNNPEHLQESEVVFAKNLYPFLAPKDRSSNYEKIMPISEDPEKGVKIYSVPYERFPRKTYSYISPIAYDYRLGIKVVQSEFGREVGGEVEQVLCRDDHLAVVRLPHPGEFCRSEYFYDKELGVLRDARSSFVSSQDEVKVKSYFASGYDCGETVIDPAQRQECESTRYMDALICEGSEVINSHVDGIVMGSKVENSIVKHDVFIKDSQVKNSHVELSLIGSNINNSALRAFPYFKTCQQAVPMENVLVGGIVSEKQGKIHLYGNNTGGCSLGHYIQYYEPFCDGDNTCVLGTTGERLGFDNLHSFIYGEQQ